MTFGKDFEGLAFTTIVCTLEDFEDRIKQALVDDGVVELPPAAPPASTGPSPSPEAVPRP